MYLIASAGTSRLDFVFQTEGHKPESVKMAAGAQNV